MGKHIADTTVLHNGVKMPWLGLGVWKVTAEGEVEHAVATAIKNGYRSIDTAAVYGNEEGVGRAIQQSGVAREDLFITTKIWNSEQGYDSTLRAFEESRKKLGLTYVDLYLIHWPVKGKYKDTWKALEKLYKDGVVRAIGVSNFHVHHLQDLMADCEIVPMVDQVEFHPLLTQRELLQFTKENNIQMEAWSPLMQGNLDLPLLKELAEKYQKTPAQIVLRWDLQQGVVTIPKSVKEQRIIENSDIFDFELSAEDVEKINGLNQNKRFGADPDNFNF
ncbi:aldo/keto reductase [Brevibacillus fulvus]|uniref:Diketogulonate reductase-like aldo/keto reductase n=1 Tax=Brevibacillus fulvus TaxID=1125967 RepID=A0A938XS67_9BACL|nr:aldo/keto reductase [Brevibacillus fulvus]MBM7589373.1 diketogulonate reductase-like aldo/keto reductase [Brevibacillus fulvus]